MVGGIIIYGINNNTVYGIVACTIYECRPPENVWLAWFAISPDLQGKGYGQKLLESIEDKAKKKGYKKFFVETYNHPDFNKAIRFYKKKMVFQKSGKFKIIFLMVRQCLLYVSHYSYL